MARPRTQGAPVQFRLPLDTEAYLTAKAQAAGVSLNEYCKTALIKAHHAYLALREGNDPTTPRSKRK